MRCNYGICKYSILRKFKRTYEKKPGLTLEKLSEKSSVSVSLLSKEKVQENSVVVGKVAMTIRNI